MRNQKMSISSSFLCVLAFSSLPSILSFAPSSTCVERLVCRRGSGNKLEAGPLFGARKKMSMKERRKQRAKKQPGFKVDRSLLDDLPPVDSWEKSKPMVAFEAGTEVEVETADAVDDDETAETQAKASSLVQSQRKSVDCLTYFRKCAEESFPIRAATESIEEKGWFQYDGFLSSHDAGIGNALLSDMLQEVSEMLANDKMQRDIARLGDAEFTYSIVGGEEYANCPRITEFVVSLTRHLPPLINKEMGLSASMSTLDATKSMGSLRVFDRTTYNGLGELLSSTVSSKRPFATILGDGEEVEKDARLLTAMLFLSSDKWSSREHGGGLTIQEGGVELEVNRDSLILLRSNVSHRQEPWIGTDQDGLEQAACVVLHFIKE
ncbi:hypothetical protein THAOC_29333 [Thalassiosira oceanica]|uniref:Prolyl 4-hydroxylase alpha subunit domain-containing protein n=1 Tax=Thalassiosira oceanica TaxID=159749 RepID=K0RE34_THAOC|nr:hypothetical protein THAOC_29333 [Thalassiosira oceanica]|mmetsp:Transcript_18907/g.44300  ORF Transcript_18907/g.44300 Transcript_18907/m.44300 type:complete len:379 (+) Transcript_18907:90-1226(+)|eukprot:EJK51490.1 hypothetical protein THAOC_29333 [Thalassiosira oceanica]